MSFIGTCIIQRPFLGGSTIGGSTVVRVKKVHYVLCHLHRNGTGAQLYVNGTALEWNCTVGHYGVITYYCLSRTLN